MEEILKDTLGIFRVSDVESSYKVNEASKHIENYIAVFRFVGKILGKAFFDSVPLNINLHHQVFMVLCGKKQPQDFSLECIKLIDEGLFNGLKFIRDNNLDNYKETIEEYFVVDVPSTFGEVREEELVQDGKKKRVTQSNKHEFIQKKCYFSGYLSV
jgi:hypothetical protein